MKTEKNFLLMLGLAGCLALAACGQRGPLYLPEKKTDKATTAAETGDPASTEKDDEAGKEEGAEDAKTP